MFFINPKYYDLAQQVLKNKQDIENLQDEIKQVYASKVNLQTTTSSVNLSDTNIPQGDNTGWLITPNALLFNIVTIVNDIVYIEYYTTLPAGPEGPQGPQGPQGPRGLQGPTGPEGPIGPTGATGPTGPRGAEGPTGPKGDSGNSFIITGVVDSADALPSASTQELGTAYFVGTSIPRDVYVVLNLNGNKVWQNQGALQGPAGPTGPEGPIGPQGETGPQGPRGAEGPQGPQGEIGETGPQGAIGLGINDVFSEDIVTNIVEYNTDTGATIHGTKTTTLNDNSTYANTTKFNLNIKGTNGINIDANETNDGLVISNEGSSNLYESVYKIENQSITALSVTTSSNSPILSNSIYNLGNIKLLTQDAINKMINANNILIKIKMSSTGLYYSKQYVQLSKPSYTIISPFVPTGSASPNYTHEISYNNYLGYSYSSAQSSPTNQERGVNDIFILRFRTNNYKQSNPLPDIYEGNSIDLKLEWASARTSGSNIRVIESFEILVK